MPQRNSNAPPSATPADQVLARIGEGLRAARTRTGMSEERVVELLGQQGLEITTTTLRTWESSGLLQVDSAVHLAAAYGTTIDTLAGRRSYRQRKPADDLPPAQRSPW
jgi:transcriptional regulator with XRE-family HTH domain